jgi:Fe2+ or Zn2+ uptake regulation protein
MIHYKKEDQRGEMHCDMCGNVDEFEGWDWNEFVKDAKENGWQVKLVVNEYRHYCPNCPQK